MSKSQSKIPSPARSLGAVTPRRARTRRALSTASPRSEASVKLSTVMENFLKDDFVLSPLKRRSVLPDDTEIEAPRRASWWKRLDGSTRDVLEALDTNKMTDDLVVEEYEFEVEKDKQNQSVPESSDNESIASIFVPQRRLFNQKKQPQGKFAEIGFRKSLGRTNIEEESIEIAPKTLFNTGPRNKPVFPAALLNSTNKAINETVEPDPTKQTRPNLFGQAGTKRKNMFTDFVLSDSEEDSEVQHKVFGFKKNNKRISLDTRNRRMPSLTPSMTTDIDIDDWNLLPSSTMIGAQEVSRMSTDDVEQVQEENQDVTLTEQNESLKRDNNRSKKKSLIENDENDKTLTNEDLLDVSNQENKINEFIKSKNKSNESIKNNLSQNKSSTRANAENEEVVLEQQNNAGTTNLTTEMNEQSLEDKMAELHGESIEKEKSLVIIQLDRTKENLENYKDTKTGNYTDGKEKHEIEPSAEERKLDASKAANDTNQNEDNDLSGKDESEGKLEQIIEERKSENRPKDASIINQDQDLNDKSKKDKSGEYMGPSVEDRVSKEHSREASSTNQEEDMENECEEELEPSAEEQDTRVNSEEASEINQDEDMKMSEKDKSEEEVEPSATDEENQPESNELCDENDDEVMEDISEKDKSKEIEHHQETQKDSKEESARDNSEEASEINQDEDMKMSEKDKSEEEVEPSATDEENQPESNELCDENDDEVMEDISEKVKSKEIEHRETQKDSKEESGQDEEMEEMVWNDNDDEKTNDRSKAGMDAETKQNDEVVPNEKGSDIGKNDRTVDRREITNRSKHVTNKSNKIVESFVDNDQMEEEVVDETQNNSTHDTTGRNRKKESIIISPEAVLQNMTNDNESFRPIGRSTTFRKSKSIYEIMNRTSLAPVHDSILGSILGSEGSRNSSTEGSEWDSHRTTRKTIRQTLGREYTTRKSLRALIMKQSAKRQTELYNKNTSNVNKTKNKTALDENDRNVSKMNKTKNKTVSEVKNASTLNKSKNKTAEINNSKNKTVLKDVNNQPIRRRTSNRNLPSDQYPIASSTVHGTSTHHLPDSLIPEQQISHHKCLHETKDPEISYKTSNRKDSINMLELNDSGPEISMNASYGQGMSAARYERSAEEHEASDVEMNNSSKQMKEIPRNASVRSRSIRNSDPEILDYEASELEKQDEEKKDSELEESENEVEARSDHEVAEQENEDSQQEIESGSENEESQQEIESGQEESLQEIESEHETQQDIESEQEPEDEQDRESLQEIESDQEEFEQEIESEHETQQESEQEQYGESEQEIESDQEESQQEIESEHETQQESEQEQYGESQQEIESDQEESQQEIESEHETQQEIESEQESEDEQDGESQQEAESDQEESQQQIESEQDESQQEIELESENEQDNDVSQPESDHESDQENRELETDSKDQRDSEDDDFGLKLDSGHNDNRSGVSRVVFDTQMMSDDEIDFEGVSRQTYDDKGVSTHTDYDNTEQSVRESELSGNARISEPVHEVSVATKKSLLLMQLQQIAQKNTELRQKIRAQVQQSLKPTRNYNTSPVPYYSVRRITKEPAKPKKKPTRVVAMEALPNAFLEDLKYKPPKRFQKAAWMTKRLYKFLETKLEPKYDYRARVRAEELVECIYNFCKLVRRHNVAPAHAVDEIKREMARLNIVNTHYEFYDFFHEFMPREISLKVNPSIINNIPMPRNGIFGLILESRTPVE